MVDKKVAASYLLLLLFHVAHVFEETWGHFRVLDRFLGLGPFLAVNWILFAIPVVILYLIITGKRAGYILGIIYAVVMVFNGLAHNIGLIVTGTYFGGFAGSFSGIGLILFGIPAAMYLLRSLPPGRSAKS